MASAKQLKILADELESNPVAKSNNIVQLLPYIDASKDEACCKIAIQALKLCFLSAFESGRLESTPNRKYAAQSTEPQDADVVYGQWLLRQYLSYLERLQSVLTTDAKASVQVRHRRGCA